MTHTRTEHDEEESCRDRNLREVTENCGLLQPDEGGEGLLQEVNFTHQNVGGLGSFRYLLHKVAVNLKGEILLRSSFGNIRDLTFVGASELSATVSFEVFLGISSPEPMKRNNQKISQTRRFILDKIFTIYKYIFSCLLFERFKPLNVKACNHNHESKESCNDNDRVDVVDKVKIC